MSISITGKLNFAANQFKVGDGRGFGIRLGVKFYNRETKAQDWTNYEAVVFAKEGSQADFYESALVKDSIVEVSGSGCQIKTFNGTVNTISILDSKLGFVSSGEATPASQNSAPQQQAQQEFPDSDIPF